MVLRVLRVQDWERIKWERMRESRVREQKRGDRKREWQRTEWERTEWERTKWGCHRMHHVNRGNLKNSKWTCWNIFNFLHWSTGCLLSESYWVSYWLNTNETGAHWLQLSQDARWSTRVAQCCSMPIPESFTSADRLWQSRDWLDLTSDMVDLNLYTNRPALYERPAYERRLWTPVEIEKLGFQTLEASRKISSSTSSKNLLLTKKVRVLSLLKDSTSLKPRFRLIWERDDGKLAVRVASSVWQHRAIGWAKGDAGGLSECWTGECSVWSE